MAIYNRICRQCGKPFKGGPRAWYCPDCRLMRRRESDARQRTKKKPDRALGSIDRCVICGKEYIVNAATQKYCKECAKPAWMEADRKQSLKYYETNRESINPARNERRRIGLIKCSECGKEFDPQGTDRLTCSPECKRVRKNRKWRENYHKHKNTP